MAKEKTSLNPARIVVESLVNAGVKVVFGIPGAKIDALFNELIDHKEIKLVICRHEQNAAFIAEGFGRLTGTPGVCVATSGPGGTNLVTALATANTEGDPVVALVGSVPRAMSLTKTHQSLKVMDVLAPISKQVSNVVHEDQIAETICNAFRKATSYPQGVTAVDLPLDVMSGPDSKIGAFGPRCFVPQKHGPASIEKIKELSEMLNQAKTPVMLLGMRAAAPHTVRAIQQFIKSHPMPVLETFQAAGCLSRDLVHLFYGRLGLFRNQPGDKVLAHSDLVITIGFDVTEYDASSWNVTGDLRIVHIDSSPSDINFYYQTCLELVGKPSDTLPILSTELSNLQKASSTTGKLQKYIEDPFLKSVQKEFYSWRDTDSAHLTSPESKLIHPLHFISTLQSLVSDDTIVISDVGSVYIWLSRYFFSYLPRHFLVSNGQQTLGVALPWAIAASLSQEYDSGFNGKRRKVVSISGDGGFMFTSMELSTAVQQGCDITHFVWNDGQYNMVAFQEEAKYGRSSGVTLGGVDFVKLAAAFDCKGERVDRAGDLEGVMKRVLSEENTGVTVVDVPIDYSGNPELMGHVLDKDMR